MSTQETRRAELLKLIHVNKCARANYHRRGASLNAILIRQCTTRIEEAEAELASLGAA